MARHLGCVLLGSAVGLAFHDETGRWPRGIEEVREPGEGGEPTMVYALAAEPEREFRVRRGPSAASP